MKLHFFKHRLRICAALAFGWLVFFSLAICCTACDPIHTPESCTAQISAIKPTETDSVTMRIYYKDSLIYKGTNKSEKRSEKATWESEWGDIVIRKGTVTIDLEVFCEKGSVHLPEYDIDIDLLYDSKYVFKTLETDENGILKKPGITFPAKESICGEFEFYGLEQNLEECDD